MKVVIRCRPMSENEIAANYDRYIMQSHHRKSTQSHSRSSNNTCTALLSVFPISIQSGGHGSAERDGGCAEPKEERGSSQGVYV